MLGRESVLNYHSTVLHKAVNSVHMTIQPKSWRFFTSKSTSERSRNCRKHPSKQAFQMALYRRELCFQKRP
jgi:hypothetical protein